MRSAYDILIVGGGFSGATLAIALLPTLQDGSSLAIIEPRSNLGHGVAYSTASSQHLLNVPARKMFCVQEDPDHFLRWLHGHYPELADPDAFLPRSIYGKYVEDTFHDVRGRHKGVEVTHFQDKALSIQRDHPGFLLRGSNERQLRAKIIVLATGNAPPLSPAGLQQLSPPLYIDYAWSEQALQSVPRNGHVVLLGAGLTAVDQVLALASQSFEGRVTMLSRRGILPAAHASHVPGQQDWAGHVGAPLNSFVKEVRQRMDNAEPSQASWHSVIDTLRPWTADLWQGLSIADRRRFLRHLRPFWEISRHRLPPEVCSRLKQLQDQKRLQVVSGRLIEVHSLGHQLQICYRDRHTLVLCTMRADQLVNCTGPAATERVKDPLTQHMLESGMARISSCGLGLEHDRDGQILDAAMQPVRGLFSVGPPRKAMLWESTAVPEIRAQVACMAGLIQDNLVEHRSLPSYEGITTKKSARL